MRSSKLTTKFQTTIPKEIRAKLNLKAGDRVNFEIHETGHVVVKKAQFIDPLAPTPQVNNNQEQLNGSQFNNDNWNNN